MSVLSSFQKAATGGLRGFLPVKDVNLDQRERQRPTEQQSEVREVLGGQARPPIRHETIPSLDL